MDYVKIEKTGVVKSVSKYSWDIGQKSLTAQGWSVIGSFSSDKPVSNVPAKPATKPTESFVPPEIANLQKDKLADPNLPEAADKQEAAEPAKIEATPAITKRTYNKKK